MRSSSASVAISSFSASCSSFAGSAVSYRFFCYFDQSVGMGLTASGCGVFVNPARHFLPFIQDDELEEL